MPCKQRTTVSGLCGSERRSIPLSQLPRCDGWRPSTCVRVGPAISLSTKHPPLMPVMRPHGLSVLEPSLASESSLLRRREPDAPAAEQGAQGDAEFRRPGVFLRAHRQVRHDARQFPVRKSEHFPPRHRRAWSMAWRCGLTQLPQAATSSRATTRPRASAASPRTSASSSRAIRSRRPSRRPKKRPRSWRSSAPTARRSQRDRLYILLLL